MATIIDKMVKSGLSAFDTIKQGGTPTQALASANRTYQSKPGDVSTSQMASAAPVTSVSNLPGVPKVITNAINAGLKSGTSAFNTIKSGGTTQEALNSANNTLTNGLKSNIQPVQQPVQQVVDPNLATQLQDLIKALQQNNQPKAIPQYQSQYNNQIADLISQFNNRPAFQFDATNNPTILANQKKAADAVTQEMGRRNILQSSITGNEMADRIAEVYATIAPQLEQQAYNQYQDQGQNLLQQIQNYQSLDNSDYNRFINSYNIGQDASQSQFNNTMSIADIINQLNVQDYNKEQDAIKFDYNKQQDAINNNQQNSQITGYLNPYPGETIDPSLSKYSSNYAQYAKDFANDNNPSNDYLVSELQKASVIKMFNDPNLLAQYGDQYKTVDQRARDVEAALAQKQAEIASDPNSYENKMKMLEYNKMVEEYNQLATYGPQEKELGLKKIQAQIAGENASASASYASANASNALAQQRANESSTSSTNGLKYTDYYKAGVEMKNAGTYDEYKNYVPRYTDQQIYTWIKGLPLTATQKANLANDIGISETAKPTEKNAGFTDYWK